MPAGAWAKIIRSRKADYAALAMPFDMAMPADFEWQPPVVDARNPDAIAFVVESDPPQLSLGLNIPRKLELTLMAIDCWQQAAWAQNQLRDPAARKAYIAAALQKVQAVVCQVQKQQAAAAGTGNARDQLGGAGGDEAWPVVVLPSPRKPSSPSRRIQIQGPMPGTPAAVQLQHVPQHPSATRNSSAGGSSLAMQPAGDSSSQSAAATAPSAETSAVGPLAGAKPDAAQGALGPGSAELQQGAHGQHLQQSGPACQQPGAAPAGPAPAQHQRQQAVEPLQAATMAVAAEQTAEAASGPVEQPTQAADAVQQQPTQACAVVVPDAAIQAAVEAQVRAAMAQQMEEVGNALQAMQEDTRLTTESVSRQMSTLREGLQQATQAGQELHSEITRQQEATQQLQQTVRSQVSRQDGATCAKDVIDNSCGSFFEAASAMPSQGLQGACSLMHFHWCLRTHAQGLNATGLERQHMPAPQRQALLTPRPPTITTTRCLTTCSMVFCNECHTILSAWHRAGSGAAQAA